MKIKNTKRTIIDNVTVETDNGKTFNYFRIEDSSGERVKHYWCYNMEIFKLSLTKKEETEIESLYQAEKSYK